MGSRTSNSIKNIFSGLGLKVILLLLQFATKTIFVRYVSDYLGLNALITSIISYLNITELGISTAINFAMYKPIADNDREKVKEYLAYYKQIYSILGIVVFVIGLVMAPFLPKMMDINELPVGYVEVYIIYALYMFGAVYPYYVFAQRGGFLAASQEEYRLTPINYTASVLSVVLQVVVLVAFKGSFVSFVLYVAMPILVSMTRSFLNGIFIAKWYPYVATRPTGKLTKNEIKGLYKNTYGIAIAKICTIVNNSIDSIIISSLIGITVLGRYSLYLTLIGMVTSFVSVLFSSLQPSIGNLNASADVEHKKELFNVINSMAFWIYGFCSICFITLAQPFMTLWAGEDKVMAISIPIIVMLNFLTSGMTSAVGIFREGCGLYYQGRYRPIFSTAVNLTASIALGYFFTKNLGEDWGVFGIVLATIVSRMLVIWWFDAYIVFKHIFGESPKKYLLQFLWRLVYISAFGCGMLFLCDLVKLPVVLTLLVRFAISVVATGAFIYLTGNKSHEFEYMKSFLHSSLLKIRCKKK